MADGTALIRLAHVIGGLYNPGAAQGASAKSSTIGAMPKRCLSGLIYFPVMRCRASKRKASQAAGRTRVRPAPGESGASIPRDFNRVK
jgi:hypothetical protein